MYKLIRFYNQNRRKIIKIILIIVFIIAIIQLLNYFSKRDNRSEKSINNENINNVIYGKEVISDKSAVTGDGVSEKQLKNDSEIINKFLNYCNEGNLNEAYNILTDECKDEMYPTIDDFKKIYYDNTFGGKKKSYTIENWMEDTYQVNITEDSLATGRLDKNETKQDYITVLEKDKTYKININNYIGRKSVNKVTETKNIKFTIQSIDTYMDYQTYNIQVENNTDNTVLLDTGDSTKSVYLLDSKKMKYYFYNNEIIKEKFKIQGKYKNTIKIKFNNSYSSSRT